MWQKQLSTKPKNVWHDLMKWIAISVLVLSIAATADAELTPNEIAVIAMADSEESRRLADHYVETRGVPESQTLLLEGKPGETMSRADWQREARPAIRAWLGDDGRRTRIRCLVTCWDVPLRIGKRDNNAPEVLARQEFLAESRANLLTELAGLVKALDGLASDAGTPQRPDPDAGAEALIAQFESAFSAARGRLREAQSNDRTKREMVVIERTFLAGGGITAYLQFASRSGSNANQEPEAAKRLQTLGGQIRGLSDGLRALARLPDSAARDAQILGLVNKSGGLVGAIRWIDRERQSLRKNETYSSFDSELSLIYWHEYPLSRWLPNLLYHRYATPRMDRPTTLMVSRLEAPTFELALKLIDTAVATEKTGLTGKVYLDARGIKFDPSGEKRGSYGEFDQSLRDLAERLEKHTELEVVLDDRAELFDDGDCPNAALYCGWYSLAKYIDAFDWQPGAVGYHLASSEAATLRTPGRKVWCNAMLEDGICATLGPVHEPYLSSFPLPDEFFSLLLTGRYTLAETYYRTKPYSSWTMVLVGDPLYNPFRNNPALSEDALPQPLRQQPPTAMH